MTLRTLAPKWAENLPVVRIETCPWDTERNGRDVFEYRRTKGGRYGVYPMWARMGFGFNANGRSFATAEELHAFMWPAATAWMEDANRKALRDPGSPTYVNVWRHPNA